MKSRNFNLSERVKSGCQFIIWSFLSILNNDTYQKMDGCIHTRFLWQKAKGKIVTKHIREDVRHRLLDSGSLSLREQFPAIPQSQILIEDAWLKRVIILSAILDLFGMITTCWHSSYLLRFHPIFTPLYFGEIGTHWSRKLLLCTLPFAIHEKDWFGEPEKCYVPGSQLRPDHGQCGSWYLIKVMSLTSIHGIQAW